MARFMRGTKRAARLALLRILKHRQGGRAKQSKLEPHYPIPKTWHAGRDNIQIAVPQRATNQVSESHTSTSSRFMVGSAKWCWFSRKVRFSAALMPLPERPHPVLLLRANDLGVRAKRRAPVKTTAHFLGAPLNCDISPDWRTPRALSLRRGAKHAAGGFGVPVPLCAAVGRIENEGPWWYRSAAKHPAQRCLTQVNTGQAPWIHLGARYLMNGFEATACDGTLIKWSATSPAMDQARMPSTMQVAKLNGFNSLPSAAGWPPPVTLVRYQS